MRKGKVIITHNAKTKSGYHEVVFSKTGNIPRGTTKRFKKWSAALKFAKMKEGEFNVKMSIVKGKPKTQEQLKKQIESRTGKSYKMKSGDDLIFELMSG